MRFPLGLSASLTSYIVGHRLRGERYVPLVLMLEPLFACNLTCSTCGRIREYRDRASQTMSLSDCVTSAQECGAPIVSICGGEPLLYRHIGELVRSLVDMRKYVYLCTNGVMLAGELDKFRPSRHLLINVHIDGPPEVHDRAVEKDGAYEAAEKGIVLATRRGFQVTVNTTVCKQTNMAQIDGLMSTLGGLGVRTFMLSPAYSYEAVAEKKWFMTRDDVRAKFRNVDEIANRHRLADTPIYLDFLKGNRELQCTAWGNPTRNVAGWRSPCYLIADQHFATYRDLIERTDWEHYGAGRDPRCENCMVHCGFEPTAALMLNRRKGDIWRMAKWQFS